MHGPRPQAGIGRLTKRSEFLAAASGRRFHTGRMTVQGLVRATGQGATSGAAERLRFGFTVTKRVGHATERNRIKRRLRSAALEAGALYADMPCAMTLDVVVIGRRDVLGAAYAELVVDLKRALRVVAKPKAPRPTPDVPGKPHGPDA